MRLRAWMNNRATDCMLSETHLSRKLYTTGSHCKAAIHRGKWFFAKRQPVFQFYVKSMYVKPLRWDALYSHDCRRTMKKWNHALCIHNCIIECISWYSTSANIPLETIPSISQILTSPWSEDSLKIQSTWSSIFRNKPHYISAVVLFDNSGPRNAMYICWQEDILVVGPVYSLQVSNHVSEVKFDK